MSKKENNYFKNLIPYLSNNINNEEKFIAISSENLLLNLRFLKNHINCQYKMLSCISGVDYLNASSTYRFSVVYDLLSLKFNNRIKIKIFINDTAVVKSITSIFKSANWWEREIWDLFGIHFEEHPDLRRILTDYGFEGYPMRKDFPLSGFTEARYNGIKKQVTIQAIQLVQESRTFHFESPW